MNGIARPLLVYLCLGALWQFAIASETDGNADLAAACPGIAIWESHRAETPTTPAAPKRATNRKLRDELLKMAQQYPDAQADTQAPDTLAQVRREQLKALQKILANGVPTTKMIGEDGARALWMLVQRADDDIELQQTYLRAIDPATTTVPLDEIALLTDRIRTHQGRAQIYGTQFHYDGPALIPYEIEDEPNLAARRQTMGLMPLADYACALKVMYSDAPGG